MNSMSGSSASGGDASAAATPPPLVRVWDAPVRVTHWLIVLCFAGAYLTRETDSWRYVHVTLGYTLAGLVVFRVLWGFVGTRHARFASFVRGPAAAWQHLRSLRRGGDHAVGHNPAGALAVVAMLALALLVAGSGWATYYEVGGEAFEEVHELLANLMLALVVVHIVAVLATSLIARENLVGAMIHGRKRAPQSEGIGSAHAGLAALIVAAVLGWWWLRWYDAPPALPATPNGERAHRHAHDDDDD
jgi:cytochrome b